MKLYKIGFNDEHFNKKVFWRWIIYGIWQGALIFYVAFDSMEYANPKDGNATSELVQGQFAYLGVVTLANLKIVTSTSNFTVWTFVWAISQTLAYVVMFYILNKFPSLELFGIFEQVFDFLICYIALFFMSSALILVDNGLHLARHEIRKIIELKEQKKEDESKRQLLQDRSVPRRKYTEFKRKAFSITYRPWFRLLSGGWTSALDH